MAEITSRRTIYAGGLVTLELLRVRQGEGAPRPREVVRHAPGVGVAAFDDRGRLLLLRQYRAPLERAVLEIVAGLVDPGERPLDAARRELREEVGLEAARWEELVTIHTSPGFTDERLTLFVARDCRHVGAAPDPGEQLTPVPTPLAEARAMVARGEISDAKSVVTILLLSEMA